MTFPNAADGIRKLFIGEILAFISAILVVCGAIFAQPVVNENVVESVLATGGMLAFAAAFVSIGGVLAIVAYIIRLIGVVKASRDEYAFKSALYMVLFTLVFAVAGSVLTLIFPGNTFLRNLGPIGTNLLDILITYLIISGIGKLGEGLKDEALQEKAGSLLKIIVAVIALRLIANTIVLLFKENIASILVIIIGGLVLVLTIVQYVLYLSLLAKAKKSLANN